MNSIIASTPTKEEIENFFKNLQSEICLEIANSDSKKDFQIENWTREEGGGGCTRILQNGAILEKAGVNFSAVYGKTPSKILEALNLPEADFFATGVSIVMHPKSPLMPIIHMNVRYFEMTNGTWWFGGGIDLTPHFVDMEDAKFFHQQLKNVCDKHDTQFYPEFKKWADDYFYIKHRNETRGIGGIFFDHLNTSSRTKSKEELFSFVKEVGNTFAPTYSYLMKKNGLKDFTEEQKKWQYLRRSRYVEFNLVYDKGTKFGLDTNGRIESILMSMPPQAHWEYDYKPVNEQEKITQSLLKKGVEWVN